MAVSESMTSEDAVAQAAKQLKVKVDRKHSEEENADTTTKRKVH